jgi:hypothetical protein
MKALGYEMPEKVERERGEASSLTLGEGLRRAFQRDLAKREEIERLDRSESIKEQVSARYIIAS